MAGDRVGQASRELFMVPLLLAFCQENLRHLSSSSSMSRKSSSRMIRGYTKASDARLLVEAAHVLQLVFDLRL